MVYAYVNNESKSLQYNMYEINTFIYTRDEFIRVKKSMKSDDTLLIETASLLGNSVTQVMKEIIDLKASQLQFHILDNMYLCDGNNLGIEVLSYLLNLSLGNKHKSGRPETKPSVKFDKLYQMYLNGETQRAIELSGLSRATFYRRLEKYEKEHELLKRRNKSARDYGETLQAFNIDMKMLDSYPLLKIQ